MEKKQRLAYVDTGKFLAMFFVAFAHIVEQGVTVPFLYSFHLPLFFFLSGLTLSIDKETRFGDFLVRKLRSYVLPLFFLDLLYYLAGLAFLLAERNASAINWASFEFFLVGFFRQERFYSAWFLPALFFSALLAYPAIKLTLKNKVLGLLAILSFLAFGLWLNTFLSAPLPWNVDASFVGGFFVYAGYFVHRLLPQARSFLEKNRIRALGFGLLFQSASFLFAYLAYHFDNSHLEMWGRNYQPFYYILPAALFGCLGMTLLSFAISNPVFAYLGKKTLFILVAQQDIAMRAAKEFWFRDWYLSLGRLPVESVSRYLYAFTVTVIAFVIGLVLYYLVRYSPFCVFYSYPLPGFYRWLTPRRKSPEGKKA